MKAMIAVVLLFAGPVFAAPLDPGNCGRHDTFVAAAKAAGFVRKTTWSDTVEGRSARAEVWYAPAREEWRVVVAAKVSGFVVAASQTCVDIYSDSGVPLTFKP